MHVDPATDVENVCTGAVPQITRQIDDREVS